MPDIFELIRTNTWAIFALGALFTFCGFVVALRSYRTTALNHRIGTVAAQIEHCRKRGVFDQAREVTAAATLDGWAVLGTSREAACAVMVQLSAVARMSACPHAWHACLSGEEWDTVTSFLDRVAPLLLVLWHSPLGIQGPNRPYNGRKLETLTELLRAMGRRAPRR